MDTQAGGRATWWARRGVPGGERTASVKRSAGDMEPRTASTTASVSIVFYVWTISTAATATSNHKIIYNSIRCNNSI